MSAKSGSITRVSAALCPSSRRSSAASSSSAADCQSSPAALARPRYLATTPLEMFRLRAMRSCDSAPGYLSLSMSLIMRISMRCCGISSAAQRPRGYAPAVVHTQHQHRPLTGRQPHSGGHQQSVGHVTEMTGHVPEFGGHDAETVGHAPPKYADERQPLLARLAAKQTAEVRDLCSCL